MGALLSAPVSGYIADRCGRKCGMMVSGIPNLIGYLILSYAHYSDRAQTFKILLFAGRFITGLGMGFISSVVSVSKPAYDIYHLKHVQLEDLYSVAC